jgi:acyl-CoA thioesterase YciA
MKFYSRKWVKPENLNPHGSLFGGQLLSWIDEEAVIFAMCQLGGSCHLVTKFMSEINFVSSAHQGDIIEMGVEVTACGRTSVSLRAEVRNKITKQTIISIDRIVFVNLNMEGQPTPHGHLWPGPGRDID